MDSVLWYVLPLAIATALSIFPILAVVLLLLSPHPVPVSVGYLAGWSLGVLALVTLFTFGASLIPPDSGEGMPNWFHVVSIALGAAMIVYGVVMVVRDRRSPEQKTSAPSWTKAMGKLGPRRSFAFGLAMNIRPKNLAIALAAGLAIGSAPLDLLGRSVAVLIFTAVGVSTVAALVLAYLFGDKRVRPSLERLSDWLVSHSAVVLAISVILLGALLIALGLAHLYGPL